MAGDPLRGSIRRPSASPLVFRWPFYLYLENGLPNSHHLGIGNHTDRRSALFKQFLCVLALEVLVEPGCDPPVVIIDRELLRLIDSGHLDVGLEEAGAALGHSLYDARDKLLVVFAGPSIDLVRELPDRELPQER